MLSSSSTTATSPPSLRARRTRLAAVGLWRALVALVIVVAVTACAPSAASPPVAGSNGRSAAAGGPARIDLPEILAVELPPGLTELPVTAPPLRELLDSARAGGLRVTHDQTGALSTGPVRVTWTAWEGAPRESPIAATRSGYLYLLPFGQSPAGATSKHNATAGNHSSKVVRDASGHVHVAWYDFDPRTKKGEVVYRRGAPDPVTGAITWEVPPTPLSDDRTGHGYVAVAAGPNTVHVAWTGHDRVRYRRLVRAAEGWRWEPIRDTGATGGSWDNGPDMSVRGDDEVHVLTYGLRYARSLDGGASWTDEAVPRPRPGVKNPALAVDGLGNAHVVFTSLARSPVEFSSSRPNGAYWQMRYVRRRAAGGWEDAHDVLAAFPGWADQGPTRDSLADWPDIAADGAGGLHLAWHGTGNSGIYGRDDAFYAYRPPSAPGAWGDWTPPQPLHPRSRATGHSFSFAPSLSVDPETDTVLAVVFFELEALPREIFDSDLVVIRSGRIVGDPIPLSRAARAALAAGRDGDALSTWFACAAPRIFRDAGGRAWLDVLQTEETPERHRSRHWVVHQRLDVTEILRASSPGARPSRAP